jgi:carbon-monoxide dehydrogenase large subunit
MLFLGMVRSPIAHAKITSIDVSEAKAATGVIAVFTGTDLADDVGPLPCGWPLSPEDKVPEYYPVAREEVNFAGEIVAVVVARSAEAARDATELVDVEYEDEQVVLDLEAAAAGAPTCIPTGERMFRPIGSSIRPKPAPAVMLRRRSRRHGVTASCWNGNSGSSG